MYMYPNKVKVGTDSLHVSVTGHSTYYYTIAWSILNCDKPQTYRFNWTSHVVTVTYSSCGQCPPAWIHSVSVPSKGDIKWEACI